ncbi:hypothetical protein HNR06_004988 [Nocardiopsis arvandica]|uniref:DUF4190 domain-containing protein n=1 Tax=Nocardiopsis sinuspersici TaxID=501010 RepID=A0A7Z0BNE0_9ACTN|nr:hypothetical protein [Nocardiopsis sinuspersici]NYH55399.1 hypothetical protein [Nocardiopsis sinuspersici]
MSAPPGGGGGEYPPPPGGFGGPPPPPGGWYGGSGFQPPQQPAIQGPAIGALIANVVGLCLCWALAIVGLILAIVALTMTSTNSQAAKTCTLISWVLFGAGIALWIVMFFFYGAAGIFAVLEEGSVSTY